MKSKLPKPPISKDMKEGKAPLRTFGDLMQFFEKDKNEEGDDKGGK